MFISIYFILFNINNDVGEFHTKTERKKMVL